MPQNGPDPIGLAALSMCESLLISLKERGLLDESDVDALLSDAAKSHAEAARTSHSASLHNRAREVIRLVQSGTNSVRIAGKIEENPQRGG